MDEEFLGEGIDFDSANAARVYDYLLGGGHNFKVDREQAAKAIEAHPEMAASVQANRAFLRRVVCWCTDRGVDQFLDLGSGVPTVGNVHEIAQATNPAARVAYVDFEPVAIAHATEILAEVPTATATRADIRDPDRVLTAPGVAGLLDFDRPVAVLAVAVLHFVAEDITPILQTYRRALAPGSVVAISHGSHDQDDAKFGDTIRVAAHAYRDSATPVTTRTRAELRELLDGLELAAPGLVDVTDWPTPTPHSVSSGFYGAVGLLR